MGGKGSGRVSVKGLDQFDLSTFRGIGGGTHGMVIGNGRFAIKLGDITEDEFITMQNAAKHRLAVPAYWYAANVRLTNEQIAAIPIIPTYGRDTTIRNYMRRDGTVDVMIMAQATPLASHERGAKIDYNRCYKAADSLKKKVRKIFGVNWTDGHEYNVGIFRNYYVILDVDPRYMR